MPGEEARLRSKLSEEEFQQYKEMDASLPKPDWYHDSSEEDDSTPPSLDGDGDNGKGCCGCC